MKISSIKAALAASLLLLGAGIQPALAHTGGGGGHSGGGGGGRSFGGHAGGGGGHVAAHYSGGYGGGAHYSGAAYGGARAASYGGGHVAAAAGYGGRAGVGAGFGGRAYAGGHYGRPGGWGGGYWGGRFWPGIYYGAGFAWFLPVLPLYCATYYWNNIPYYYYNDAYYTWSPTADGYVATDPPPSQTASVPSDAGPAAYSGADQSGPAPAGDNIYAYPSQGQSEAQQVNDRQECAQWASSQAGAATGSPDYHRALIACFQGRGYSAQ
jgi:hypothetical protein